MSDISNAIALRHKDYTGDMCWQRQIRTRNLNRDITESGLSIEQIRSLRTEDFVFYLVDKEDKEQCAEVKLFIEENEWLGCLPNRPTQRFVARTVDEGLLVGVIVMAVPNAFSSLLGEEFRDKEKLVSRGASISWAPKNTASWLLMNSLRWMVKHTEFRIFTAYSDPEAKELGTIYQACNWIYLGQTSGTDKQYFDPEKPKMGWFSSRHFRHKSVVKKHAKELGIRLEKEWWDKYTLNRERTPEEIIQELKIAEKAYQKRCLVRPTPQKHKYCYILGRTPKETNFLRREFKRRNPHLVDLPYPKKRGE